MAQPTASVKRFSRGGFYDEPGRHTGLAGWLLSTDHKRIGLLYFAAMMIFFLTAVSLGFLMRLEMLTPGKTIVEPQTYNTMFTLHGIMMIFLFIIPGLPAVFGNFMLPLLIGAKDVFFPRLNLLSWYLFITGGLLALVSVFLPGGAADTGWTFYVPYSIRTSTNVIPALMAAFILGFSSIVTGLNFITTIHRMRAPGMDWFKMPLFVWSLYATAWVQVLATPIIGITLLLVAIERWFGVGIFDPALGGDPVLYQHLFLDLLPPGCVHYDSSRSWSGLRNHPCIRAPDDFRVQVHRILKHRHCPGRLAGLGPPHVYRRHEQYRHVCLLAADVPRINSERNQDFQLDCHAVQRVHSCSKRPCCLCCRLSCSLPSVDSQD